MKTGDNHTPNYVFIGMDIQNFIHMPRHIGWILARVSSSTPRGRLRSVRSLPGRRAGPAGLS